MMLLLMRMLCILLDVSPASLAGGGVVPLRPLPLHLPAQLHLPSGRRLPWPASCGAGVNLASEPPVSLVLHVQFMWASLPKLANRGSLLLLSARFPQSFNPPT